jgi:hypothetical protein
MTSRAFLAMLRSGLHGWYRLRPSESGGRIYRTLGLVPLFRLMAGAFGERLPDAAMPETDLRRVRVQSRYHELINIMSIIVQSSLPVMAVHVGHRPLTVYAVLLLTTHILAIMLERYKRAVSEEALLASDGGLLRSARNDDHDESPDRATASRGIAHSGVSLAAEPTGLTSSRAQRSDPLDQWPQSSDTEPTRLTSSRARRSDPLDQGPQSSDTDPTRLTSSRAQRSDPLEQGPQSSETSAALKPTAFYGPYPCETERLYVCLGVEAFRRFVLSLIRLSAPADEPEAVLRNIVGGREGLLRFDAQTRIAERTHLFGLTLHVPFAVVFMSARYGPGIAFVIVLFGLNLICALLQRQHRVRIRRVMGAVHRRRGSSAAGA